MSTMPDQIGALIGALIGAGIEAAVDRFGGLDMLVNNAGMGNAHVIAFLPSDAASS